MPSSNTSSVRSVVKDFNEYNLSGRKAANRRRAPRSTVNHRLAGRPERGIPARRYLSELEESCLVNLVLDLQRQGQPATRVMVRYYAELLLRSRGKDVVFGKRWTTRFWRRHSELNSKPARPQLWEKLKSLMDDGIDNFFDHFEGIAERESIPEQRWINMDEKDTQLGSPASDKVLFSKATGPAVAAFIIRIKVGIRY